MLALRFIREISIDRKMERQVQRLVCSSFVVHKYIDKEQSLVTKRRASVIVIDIYIK